jgi:hypothetical protein
MSLRYESIQLLRLPQANGGVVPRLVVRNRGRIRATLITGELLGKPWGANGFL